MGKDEIKENTESGCSPLNDGLCGCGNLATKLVQMHTHQHEPEPICEECAERHEANAAEVNDHEMRNFGGAYGLVSWTYLPLTHNAELTRRHTAIGNGLAANGRVE
ncbi:MAG: hypothetical protein ABL933_15850 [Methyloglobulus sp.]